MRIESNVKLILFYLKDTGRVGWYEGGWWKRQDNDLLPWRITCWLTLLTTKEKKSPGKKTHTKNKKNIHFFLFIQLFLEILEWWSLKSFFAKKWNLNFKKKFLHIKVVEWKSKPWLYYHCTSVFIYLGYYRRRRRLLGLYNYKWQSLYIISLRTYDICSGV